MTRDFQPMREGPEWLVGGAEITHALGAPGGRVTLHTRFLGHEDFRRSALERWTHARTFVGRVFLSVDATVRIRVGRRWHALKRGEFFLLPPGPGFAAEYGPGRLLCQLFLANDAMGVPVWREQGPFRLSDPPLAAALTRASSHSSPGLLDCLSHQILLRFVASRLPELVQREAAWRPFSKLERLLRESRPAEWRVDVLAATLGCSAAALSKRFRRSLGLSLKDYLIGLTVREAQRRLAESCAPASAVAETLGFQDPAYFHRLFQRQTGVSPSIWRQHAQGRCVSTELGGKNWTTLEVAHGSETVVRREGQRGKPSLEDSTGHANPAFCFLGKSEHTRADE